MLLDYRNMGKILKKNSSSFRFPILHLNKDNSPITLRQKDQRQKDLHQKDLRQKGIRRN